MVLGNHPIILVTNSKTSFKLHPVFVSLRGPPADRMALGWPLRESKVHGILPGWCKDCLKIAPSLPLSWYKRKGLTTQAAIHLHLKTWLLPLGWVLNSESTQKDGTRMTHICNQSPSMEKCSMGLRHEPPIFSVFLFDHPRPPAWLGCFPSNLRWSS